MKRRWITSLGLLVLLAATPALGQETVIGFFAGPVEGANAGTGAIGVTGWVLATSGVERVTIQVDGIDVGAARYGERWPEVEDLDFPDSAGAGFAYNLNSVPFENGVHLVSAKVQTFGGTIVVIPAVLPDGSIVSDGKLEVRFTNNTSILAPFGEINRPLRNADLFGTCNMCGNGVCDAALGESCRNCPQDCNGIQEPPIDNPNNFCCGALAGLNPVGCDSFQCTTAGWQCSEETPRRFEVVHGWALDLGVEIGDAGIGWVELLVDGEIVGNTRTGCEFDIHRGGLSNCYGLARLDIERRFPFALDAPSSGYRFVLDVGHLVDEGGFVQGHHTLTIRAGDISNQNANVDEVPVNFFCTGNLGFNQKSFGAIEIPGRGVQVADIIYFRGWALDGDAQGIDFVELFIDGGSIGNALFPVPGLMRPEVLAEFPGFPNSLHPVWRLAFDTNNLSEGTHQLQVQVTDHFGDKTIIGERSFLVNNVID